VRHQSLACPAKGITMNQTVIIQCDRFLKDAEAMASFFDSLPVTVTGKVYMLNTICTMLAATARFLRDNIAELETRLEHLGD